MTFVQVSWEEPIFADNVKITHVMASKLPGYYLREGRHDVLYQVLPQSFLGHLVPTIPQCYESSRIFTRTVQISASGERVERVSFLWVCFYGKMDLWLFGCLEQPLKSPKVQRTFLLINSFGTLGYDNFQVDISFLVDIFYL